MVNKLMCLKCKEIGEFNVAWGNEIVLTCTKCGTKRRISMESNFCVHGLE